MPRGGSTGWYEAFSESGKGSGMKKVTLVFKENGIEGLHFLRVLLERGDISTTSFVRNLMTQARKKCKWPAGLIRNKLTVVIVTERHFKEEEFKREISQHVERMIGI